MLLGGLHIPKSFTTIVYAKFGGKQSELRGIGKWRTEATYSSIHVEFGCSNDG